MGKNSTLTGIGENLIYAKGLVATTIWRTF